MIKMKKINKKEIKEKIKNAAKTAALVIAGAAVGIGGMLLREYLNGDASSECDLYYKYKPEDDPDMAVRIMSVCKTRNNKDSIYSMYLSNESAQNLRNDLNEDFGDQN